jgi:hypothetical protein
MKPIDRLVRKIGMFLASFMFAFPFACAADEAQDAVDLLSYALQCSTTPYRTTHGMAVCHDIDRFKGSANLLRIEGDTKCDDGSVTTGSWAVKFADIDETEFARNAAGRLVLWVFSSQGINFSKFTALDFCDAETAKSAKLAIDTLIRLNKVPAVAGTTKAGAQLAYNAYDNRDMDGGDLTTLKNVDLASCISACKSESECQAYSFDKWNRYCFLKSSVGSLRLDPRSTTGIRQGLATPPTAAGPITMVRYRGKLFPGTGYRTLDRAQFDSCESTCKQEQSCVAFTFQKSEQRCQLFNTTGEYFANSQTDSGVKTQE